MRSLYVRWLHAYHSMGTPCSILNTWVAHMLYFYSWKVFPIRSAFIIWFMWYLLNIVSCGRLILPKIIMKLLSHRAIPPVSFMVSLVHMIVTWMVNMGEMTIDTHVNLCTVNPMCCTGIHHSNMCVHHSIICIHHPNMCIHHPNIWIHHPNIGRKSFEAALPLV